MNRLLKLEKTKRLKFMCLSGDDKILEAYIKELENAEVSIRSIADSVTEAPFSLEFESWADKYGELAEKTTDMYKICDEIDNLTKALVTIHNRVTNK